MPAALVELAWHRQPHQVSCPAVPLLRTSLGRTIPWSRRAFRAIVTPPASSVRAASVFARGIENPTNGQGQEGGGQRSGVSRSRCGDLRVAAPLLVPVVVRPRAAANEVNGALCPDGT